MAVAAVVDAGVDGVGAVGQLLKVEGECYVAEGGLRAPGVAGTEELAVKDVLEVAQLSLDMRRVGVELCLQYLDGADTLLAEYHVGGSRRLAVACRGDGVVAYAVVLVVRPAVGVAGEVDGVLGEVDDAGELILFLCGECTGIGIVGPFAEVVVGAILRPVSGLDIAPYVALIEPPAVAVAAGKEGVVLCPDGGFAGMLACEGLQGVDEGIGGIHLIEARDIAHNLIDCIAFLEPIGLSAVEAHAAEAEGEAVWLTMAAAVREGVHILAAQLC